MKLSKSIIILLVALILLSVVVGVGLIFFYPKAPAKPAEVPAATAPAATPGTPVPDEFDPVEWTRDPKSPALQAPAAAPTSGDGFTVTLPPAEKTLTTSTLPASPGATFPGDAPAVNEPQTKPVVEAPAATPKAVPAPKAAPVKAAPVKAAPAKAAPKTVKVSEYWIQVASFKDRFQAENTAKALETQGLKGTLTTATVNGQAVVRVRVGPYANADEAAKFLAWLTPVKEFASSYVTKVSATRAAP